ncbi:DNA repair exonuclease SbcCD ATPase subunit [Bacillus niacini]|uniref:DNA repair exonuclease SbcCD ATPase subunit n=1 Tax=Neobacillus niacini TaxID=86668 RepID=A0A852T985_9BACI|nr:YkyA family protein [Neobacillus niacini]NYE05360.1 DNA repair exonuclease SbcCD ATPase subunit [Neobacillus niacini]
MSAISVKRIIFSTLAISFLLTGCVSKEKTTERMYQALENIVEAEKAFEEQQEPLVELEKQEKEIYNQIMALGMKQHDEIVKLSDEALSIIDKRREHLQKEIDSINASKAEFKNSEEIRNEIDNSEQRKKVTELLEIMSNRYKVHNKLAKEYSTALDNDKELYQMLKNESISYEKLEDHVTNLNTIYQKVYDANEEFNELTAQYNKKKLEFYEEAGLKLENE